MQEGDIAAAAATSVSHARPELNAVLDELKAREPIFHRPEQGTARADYERMTVEDFWETGASGRQYPRDLVLDALEDRPPDAEPLVASGFRCRWLAGEVYLLTYTLLQPGQRWTRRCTIWERTSEGWRSVYHQGTVMEKRPE